MAVNNDAEIKRCMSICCRSHITHEHATCVKSRCLPRVMYPSVLYAENGFSRLASFAVLQPEDMLASPSVTPDLCANVGFGLFAHFQCMLMLFAMFQCCLELGNVCLQGLLA